MSAAVTIATGLGFGLRWICKPKSGRAIDNFDPELEPRECPRLDVLWWKYSDIDSDSTTVRSSFA